MVVLWKETSGRQPQIITPENEGGDETNYLRQPSLSLMIPMFLLDLVDLQDLLNLLVRLAYHQDGLQLHRLLVIEKELNVEVHRLSDCIRHLHQRSLNLFQSQ